eukprot:2926485-Pleurochrysis_carterae.AAC.1
MSRAAIPLYGAQFPHRKIPLRACTPQCLAQRLRRHGTWRSGILRPPPLLSLLPRLGRCCSGAHATTSISGVVALTAVAGMATYCCSQAPLPGVRMPPRCCFTCRNTPRDVPCAIPRALGEAHWSTSRVQSPPWL